MTITMAAFSARVIAVATAIPLVVFFVLSVVSETSRFADPCVSWGAQAGHQMSIGPVDRCQSVSGTSETKLGVVGRLLFVQGTSVVAAFLGLLGAYRSRPLVTLVGAILLFILSIPLMLSGLGFVVLVLAMMLVISYQFNHSAQRKAA